MIYPDLDVEIPEHLGRVHFVGIGGSGMSGIARMMHEAGLSVSGSDRQANAATTALEALGMTIYLGHDAAQVADADTVVVTGALWQDNPEVAEARRRGLPVLHRSQALAWLTRGNRVVSVAGAHGKTTSTGMLVTALLELGARPNFVNGGVIETLGVSAAAGDDNLFVLEADESDRSFLLYDTSTALVTNVDPEHLDFYGSREAFMEAFVDFSAGARERLVISADDPGANEVRKAVQLRVAEHGNGHLDVVTFGWSSEARVRIVEIDASDPVTFTVEVEGERHAGSLRVLGAHNVTNAVGVLAVLVSMGYDIAESLLALSKFGGTKRRFEFHAEVDGVRVFDDYAHHPTEVEALLAAARSIVGSGRLIAIHQPHLFSRTAQFHREFAQVLERGADYTVVLDVDGAREDPVPGVTGALVADDFKDESRVRYIDDWQRAADHLADIAQPGDVMVTMSCGSVYRIIPTVVRALESRSKLGAG